MSQWRSRAEQVRLRCRATEWRKGQLVQCSENRKIEHNHQFRGKPFGPGYSVPTPGQPTVGPGDIRMR